MRLALGGEQDRRVEEQVRRVHPDIVRPAPLRRGHEGDGRPAWPAQKTQAYARLRQKSRSSSSCDAAEAVEAGHRGRRDERDLERRGAEGRQRAGLEHRQRVDDRLGDGDGQVEQDQRVAREHVEDDRPDRRRGHLSHANLPGDLSAPGRAAREVPRPKRARIRRASAPGPVMLRYLARRLAFSLLLVAVVSSAALLLTLRRAGRHHVGAGGHGRHGASRSRPSARGSGWTGSSLEQYGAWLSRAVRLDFGTSLMYGRPVAGLVAERARNTLLLAVAAPSRSRSWRACRSASCRAAGAGSCRARSARRRSRRVSMPTLVSSLAAGARGGAHRLAADRRHDGRPTRPRRAGGWRRPPTSPGT